MTVDAASKHFINRDFSLALAELGAFPFDPQPKPWILYLALCDRAFVEPDKPAWPLNGSERKSLRAATIQGEFWEPLSKAWEPVSSPIPLAVVAAGMGVTARHGGKAGPAAKFAEDYLVSLDDADVARSAASTFISQILLGLEHDFEYARALASNALFDAHEEERARILADIDASEKQFQADRRKEAELVARLEQERLAAAIVHTQQEEASPVDGASPNQPAPLSSLSIDSAARKAIDRRAEVPRRPRQSLPQLWRGWFREFIRSQGFYNFLLLVFTLCGLATSAGLRRQAAKMRTWLWSALVQSVRMGFTVTYL